MLKKKHNLISIVVCVGSALELLCAFVISALLNVTTLTESCVFVPHAATEEAGG